MTAYARQLDKASSTTTPTLKSEEITCFGIRPSLRQTGWAVLAGREPQEPQLIDSGIIETDSSQPLPLNQLSVISYQLSVDDFTGN